MLFLFIFWRKEGCVSLPILSLWHSTLLCQTQIEIIMTFPNSEKNNLGFFSPNQEKILFWFKKFNPLSNQVWHRHPIRLKTQISSPGVGNNVTAIVSKYILVNCFTILLNSSWMEIKFDCLVTQVILELNLSAAQCGNLSYPLVLSVFGSLSYRLCPLCSFSSTSYGTGLILQNQGHNLSLLLGTH